MFVLVPKITKVTTIRPFDIVFEKSNVVSKGGKESRKRRGVAQRFPGGLGSQVFMTFST
jgi:hypothetical protein